MAQALPAWRRPWFLARCRGALLQQDLEALSLKPAAPPPELAVDLEPPGAAWGSLYVLEGSALGSQLIASRLREAHGIGPTNGGAYFGARGEATGALWREFRLQLEHELPTPSLQAAACRAAVQTFDALGAAFGKVPA